MTFDIAYAIWIAVTVLALVALAFLVAELVLPYSVHDLPQLRRGRQGARR